MAMNFKAAWAELFKNPQPIPVSAVKFPAHLSDNEKNILRNLGVYVNNLSSLISQTMMVNYDRISEYREAERSLQHPMMSAAIKLYVSFATNFDRVNNSTVWITSPSSKYQNLGEEFLDIIGIEEKITDWTSMVAQFGDFFVEPKGIPGVGIVSTDDSEHPINLSRIDKDGVLIGFYKTPLGNVSQTQKLLPPWQYVHFKIANTIRRRPIFGEVQSNEFRSISLLSPDIRRLSAKYGRSLLGDAIPTYKRMRLTEDSLMLAALSKRILRYIIKVGVNSNNIEAVKEVLDQYSVILKRSVAMDTKSGNFTDNLDFTDVVTDIILPVWDNINNLQVDKMGGEVDIKWIADLDDQRAMLATALDVPLTMLGGFTSETPSGLNTSAAESISITFARKARALQRSMIEGIRRMFQLHLAYQGLDPDLSLFDVCMSDSSTAEEAERTKALKDTVDSIQTFSDYIINLLGDRIDRIWLLDYLNNKFLKLNDFDVNKLLTKPQDHVVVTREKINKTSIKQLLNEAKVSDIEKEKILKYVDENFIKTPKQRTFDTDVRAHLPLMENKKGVSYKNGVSHWTSLYGTSTVMEESVESPK